VSLNSYDINMRLKDKVAIITGGGSGIGRGIALEFSNQGAKVVIAGRRIEPLNEVVSQIEKNGAEALSISCDVSNSTSVKQMVDDVIAKFGQIDILCNNAGIAMSGDTVNTTEKDWEILLSVDLKGVFLCSKFVLPHMLEKGRGKIINIASIAGLVGFGQSAAYAAAKGAVVNLTRQMASDYSAKGICVNAIAPGFIETDMTKDYLASEEFKKGILAKTPIGRIGKPKDIASGALYLASDESDFVTGEMLVIDGGYTII